MRWDVGTCYHFVSQQSFHQTLSIHCAKLDSYFIGNWTKLTFSCMKGLFLHQLQGIILPPPPKKKDRINAKLFCCVVSVLIQSFCYCTSSVQNELLYFKNNFWSLVWTHRNVCALLCIHCPSGGTVVSQTPFTLVPSLNDNIQHKANTSMLLDIEVCPKITVWFFCLTSVISHYLKEFCFFWRVIRKQHLGTVAGNGV